MDSLNSTIKTQGTRYLDEAWNINPGTVYGALIAFMLLMLIIAGLIIWKLYTDKRKSEDKFADLLEKNIQVVEAFTNKFDGDGKELQSHQLKDSIRGIVQQEMQAIKEALNDLKK